MISPSPEILFSWNCFPKFIISFLGASLVTLDFVPYSCISFLYFIVSKSSPVSQTGSNLRSRARPPYNPHRPVRCQSRIVIVDRHHFLWSRLDLFFMRTPRCRFEEGPHKFSFWERTVIYVPFSEYKKQKNTQSKSTWDAFLNENNRTN